MTEPVLSAEDERKLAIALFNETWALLENPSRTPAEDDRMLHVAHASRFRWDNVGSDQHRAVGEWQCSRVYATLGRGEPAVFHALRSLTYASSDGVDGWVMASAHEGLARAQIVAGELDAARDSRDRALELAEKLADPEDKNIVLGDIATLPIA